MKFESVGDHMRVAYFRMCWTGIYRARCTDAQLTDVVRDITEWIRIVHSLIYCMHWRGQVSWYHSWAAPLFRVASKQVLTIDRRYWDHRKPTHFEKKNPLCCMKMLKQKSLIVGCAVTPWGDRDLTASRSSWYVAISKGEVDPSLGWKGRNGFICWLTTASTERMMRTRRVSRERERSRGIATATHLITTLECELWRGK